MELQIELIAAMLRAQGGMLAWLEKVDGNREIYPLWTIREVLAHLCGWDDSLLAVMDSLEQDQAPLTPAWRGIDAYNAETVLARDGLDYDPIFREYVETRLKVLFRLQKMSSEQLTAVSILPWGSKGTLADFCRVIIAHELEHTEDVKKLADGFNADGDKPRERK